ncbi:broad specificity phosphatase PhoE [Williamsia limnetica]|jgi:broad specificity phosphatase PhoE|uniref:Broad specificity phosphatase PhoE n=1 Tax=Williamsia limnetica TaxID=882452 RepID=A0A318RNV6_WILLI|nr:histidine phosphatase family protein [Williamsia limnetica]PYE18072.1 broad specificity phosphatase PhoE [Williamsia limnetica]
MGVIYLVRHGQAGTDENGYGSLTELGRQQARNVGKKLAARIPKVDFTVSGNLARQLETIEEIVGQFPDSNAPTPVVNAGWNEYDLTRLAHTDVPPTGTSQEAAQAQRSFQRRLDASLLTWAADEQTTGPGSYVDYRASMLQALEEIAAHAGPGQVAIAASSAGTIGAVVAHLWGISPENWPSVSRTMVNASITKLIVGKSGINVMSVNDHAHADVDDDDGRRLMMTMR